MTTAEANRKCAEYIRSGKERYDSEIRNVTDWDIFENLSSLRHAALYWYTFPENAKVLELGCGSGALTGLLCDRADEVYALDSDPVGCDNVKRRFSGRNNLTVVNEDIEGFDPPCRFDLVVAVDFAELYKGDIRAALEKVRGEKAAMHGLVRLMKNTRKPGTPISIVGGADEALNASWNEFVRREITDTDDITDALLGCVIMINSGPRAFGIIYRI